MYRSHFIEPRRLKLYGRQDLDRIPQIEILPERERRALATVTEVFPFRINNYVLSDLIDWERWDEDPIFKLVFPQAGMLDYADFELLYEMLRKDAPRKRIEQAVQSIRMHLNPHPAGQADLNVPYLDRKPLPGLQHKYRETVLFFPRQGQTCHTYCTYCFRWPQFIGDPDLKIAASEIGDLVQYLKRHREVSDVLITGGDPMIMSSRILRSIVSALLVPELSHVRNIRIGTKVLSWWPYRFVTDRDSSEILGLFDEVVQAGRHLAFMAHFSHPRELEPPIVEEAIRRIIATGVVIRCQSPLVRHVNSNVDAWVRMWNREVRLGCIPYYMFVARNTGATRYFEVPLLEAWEIFRGAYSQVSGLARSARGPAMSAMPGKAIVSGVSEIDGEEVLVLELVQARNPDWCGKPFFARLDPTATWLSDLRPALGADEFFFEPGMRRLQRRYEEKLRNAEARA